jgi:glutamine amidotransferase-like uncharacterized protein
MKNKYITVRYIFILIGVVLLFSGCSENNKSVSKKQESDTKPLNVGVFDGNGASAVCVLETLEALKIDPGIKGSAVTAYEIQNGILDNYDVLIFPGGSGSKEYNNLGQIAAENVQKFASEGKGIVGICAGGYLFATTDGYPSLKIIKAHTYRFHYNRGRGLIGFELTDKGAEIFPELKGQDKFYVQYYDGPIYDVFEPESMNILGKITTDIATHKGDPKGLTPGKPAFLTSTYGKGKVFVSVGHPEATAGMRWIVPRMARYVAGAELVSYPETVVRPEINNHEILYFPPTMAFETENFWKLFSNDESVVISAIDNLASIRSRPSIRWAKGLLRNKSKNIRLKAAGYLVDTEYTDAIPDLKSAVENEKDPEAKKILKDKLNELLAMIK